MSGRRRPSDGDARCTSARMPSGLCATSKSQFPRRSSRPGNPRRREAARRLRRGRRPVRSRAAPSGSPCATAALRRWCGPARLERPRPLVVRRAATRTSAARHRPRPGATGLPRLAPEHLHQRRGRARRSRTARPAWRCRPSRAAISSSVSPEVLHVVALDLGHRAHERPQHVGAVEPPAEPHLDHRDLAPRAREVGEGDGGRGLEEGRLPLQDERPAAGRSTSPPRPRRSARRPPGCARGTTTRWGDVYRPDPPAGLAQRRRHQGRDAALPVRPADVDRRASPRAGCPAPSSRARVVSSPNLIVVVRGKRKSSGIVVASSGHPRIRPGNDRRPTQCWPWVGRPTAGVTADASAQLGHSTCGR